MVKNWRSPLVSGVLVVALTVASCGPLYAQSSRMGASTPPHPVAQYVLTRKQKIVLLVGAAALAYLYFKHRQNKGAGPNGQYYRSRNGRIYYRDAKGVAHWVTPPRGGIRVPASEAAKYQNATM